MRLFSVHLFSGPLVAVGALVAVACLAASWYINRSQADLAQAVRNDAAGVDAADDLQLQLRHLRVHTLTLVAERTDGRREEVHADFVNVDRALQAIHQTAATPDDAILVERINEDYATYKGNLHLDQLPSTTGPISEVAHWSDSHHMRGLLAPCRELADRKRERMKNSLERSEVQTLWAGPVFFGLGFAGILAGLLSGYSTARALTRRVARLSIRVQAVRAHLDQEVDALTLQRPTAGEDLDEQLDQVVERVSAVCRRLQEQERDLLRAEQLAAVGQLAAGVAHEIRNPLTGVKILLQAAVRTKNPTPLTVERLHLLLNEVARIERTVQGMMDFAVHPPPDRRPQDLREVIDEAVNIAQSRGEFKSIAIRVQPAPGPLPATMDRDQILSLLTNLLFNAIDACPVGGEVGVSTESGSSGVMKINITDSGPGIGTMGDRLFTPFVTTKPTGTGLGLTIARKVAQEHGGTLIAADSTAGGACFTLTLPIAEKGYAKTPDR